MEKQSGTVFEIRRTKYNLEGVDDENGIPFDKNKAGRLLGSGRQLHNFLQEFYDSGINRRTGRRAGEVLYENHGSHDTRRVRVPFATYVAMGRPYKVELTETFRAVE